MARWDDEGGRRVEEKGGEEEKIYLREFVCVSSSQHTERSAFGILHNRTQMVSLLCVFAL